MFLDSAIMINNYIESLQEPQRFFMFLLVYAGLPILCIILLYIDHEIELKKAKKEIEGISKKCREQVEDM